jgi:hypothetical protein
MVEDDLRATPEVHENQRSTGVALMTSRVPLTFGASFACRMFALPLDYRREVL